MHIKNIRFLIKKNHVNVYECLRHICYISSRQTALIRVLCLHFYILFVIFVTFVKRAVYTAYCARFYNVLVFKMLRKAVF